jgi:cytoskeletal protein CcmA (bactofilin family)
MFEKKQNGQVPACHTLLGKGTLWKGEIHTGTTSLRIEGSVEGTIHSEGEVTIAPSGVVKGAINAKHMIVTGHAEGVFRIEQCLEIHGTGCVEGEVEVGALVVDEGGILQGTCIRRGHKGSIPVKHGLPAGTAAPKATEPSEGEPVAVGPVNGPELEEKPLNGQSGAEAARHRHHAKHGA